jgi:hypothetical protein
VNASICLWSLSVLPWLRVLQPRHLEQPKHIAPGVQCSWLLSILSILLWGLAFASRLGGFVRPKLLIVTAENQFLLCIGARCYGTVGVV